MNHISQKSKEDFWKKHVSKFKQTGLSRRQYCLNENLSYWTFLDWQKKIEKTTEASLETKLVKIPRQINPQVNNRDSKIELLIAEKLSIRIAPGFDGDLLRDLIRELGVRI